MPKPVILAIDDEPLVLNAVERDLRRRFGSDYRIIKAGSGEEALEVVHRLKRRNSSLALFIVDQRMPNMTGTEFLVKARPLYPEAKKVLLTAYADTEAAILSINQINLDYYFVKPWDPPEDNFYPVLEELLADWAATVPLPYEGIRVAGTLWSAASHKVKDFLARNQIPYQWLNIETDEQARLTVEEINRGEGDIPVVLFPDGSFLVQPSLPELAEKVGLYTRAANPFYDLIIVGAGPAGLAAAVYGASEGLRTLMIEKEATGGQAGTSSRIENYLGFPNGLSGADLARRATIQARRFGVEILTAGEAVGMQVKNSYRTVRLSNGDEVSCHVLLVATGVSVRRLVAPGIDRLTGAGVYYGAALTEAVNYRDQHVYLVGGANSAGQAAMFFSRYASQVTMLVRGSSLSSSMSKYLIDQIDDTQNIDTLFNVEVVEVQGDYKLEEIFVKDNTTGEIRCFPAAALFIFIGAVPRTEMVAEFVERDRAGFILTGQDLLKDGRYPSTWSLKRDPYLLETSCPGVFAAGDVRHGSVKRIASAVGEGAVAIQLAHQYLKTV